MFDRLVYGKLRAAMGGKVQYAVSGGAPLGARLGHFFRGIGVTILEGYGLTETTAPATVNRPGAAQDRHRRPAAAGRRRSGSPTTARSWSRASTSSRGYWNNAEATAEAMRDGWFHTGDIGELDDDGFLTITGRKKEILVTAGGKNVAPAVLEDRIRAHPLVCQCIVVGDQKPFIAALVTLDAEMLPDLGRPTTASTGDGRRRGAATHERRARRGAAAVDDANKAVCRAESIRKFAHPAATTSPRRTATSRRR